jgi:integrase
LFPGLSRRDRNGYGSAGDKFSPKAYDSDPSKPIGTIKEAWEAAKLRAGKTLYGDQEASEEIAPLQCRFHDLRHTTVSRMLNAGVPIAKVAKIVRWSTAEWLPAMDISL